jgi:hypothetical protein
MDELSAYRVIWGRRGVPRNYIGSLRASSLGIRLWGRDPGTGLEVTLSIPRCEVERVHVAETPDDEVAGEPGVVVELVDSAPILLREVGLGSLHAVSLTRRLLAAVTQRDAAAAAI